MDRTFHWFYLAHLGYNMWEEPQVDKFGIHNMMNRNLHISASDTLRFEEDYWQELTRQLKAAGCTAILLDLGEGVRYDSHPELVVKGSWSKEKLAGELARLRGEGFAVYPKLNFSAGHDQWLGEYSRMVSTSVYYQVVRDLIDEAAELFDTPAYFHLGMDEEMYRNQTEYNFVVIRQGEQWWHDLNLMFREVLHTGSRPWIWSDYGWWHREEFFSKMSKDAVQSNWYYNHFHLEQFRNRITLYDDLEKAGFDQVPTSSITEHVDGFQQTMRYCHDHISPERCLGYMQTVWAPTLRHYAENHNTAVSDLREGIEIYRELNR